MFAFTNATIFSLIVVWFVKFYLMVVCWYHWFVRYLLLFDIEQNWFISSPISVLVHVAVTLHCQFWNCIHIFLLHDFAKPSWSGLFVRTYGYDSSKSMLNWWIDLMYSSRDGGEMVSDFFSDNKSTTNCNEKTTW